MNWQAVADFIHRHQEGLEIFALSGIVTMRKTLPWPFSRVPPLEWSYEWLREALLTFMSIRGPIPHGSESQTSERVVKAADGSLESVKETTVSGAAPVDPKPADAQPDEPKVTE